MIKISINRINVAQVLYPLDLAPSRRGPSVGAHRSAMITFMIAFSFIQPFEVSETCRLACCFLAFCVHKRSIGFAV
jgi:hypothetical protein